MPEQLEPKANTVGRIYDELGERYLEHATTKFFYELQEAALRKSILVARDRVGVVLERMKVLNVGPGPEGNSRLMTGALNEGSFLPWNITYLDLSKNALDTYLH